MPIPSVRSLEVIVFTYNYARFLPACLHGLELQTRYPNLVRVSDDHSTDDNEATLREVVGRFPRAQLRINPENLGAVEHFRQRIGEVTCDAYMLYSGDDFLVDPTFLADAMRILELHEDIVMVCGHLRQVNEDGDPLPPPEQGALSGWHAMQGMDGSAPESWTRLPGAQVRARLAFENVIPAVCNVIRSRVHQQLPAFPIANPQCHDWQQWYLLSYLGDFARIERPVICYRVHQANLTHRFESEQQALSLLDLGYQQLLARPEITSIDRRNLRLGRYRKYLLDAPLRQLPARILRHLAVPAGMTVLKEAACRRCSRKLLHWAARSRARVLPAITSSPGNRLNGDTTCQ